MLPPPASKPPGIKQIAQKLGISIGTVSRSLNNRYGVNSKTREAVLSEARKLGYVPNEAARSLKAHPRLMLGLFYSAVRGGIEEIDSAELDRLTVFQKSAGDAGMAASLTLCTNLADFKRQADAINVAVFHGHFERDVLAAAHVLGIPAMLLRCPSVGFDDQISFRADSAKAGAVAVEYLAALGHERIGLILSPLKEDHARGLLAGYQRAIAEFYLGNEDQWVVEMPPEHTEHDRGCAGVERLLALRVEKRPTAVIFASDWMAFGGLRAALEAGLKVPEDLSLIGFGNLEIAVEASPPLTTFEVSLEKEARLLIQLAADLGLHRRAMEREEDRAVLLEPDLIRRKSCRCVRQPARISPDFKN